MHWWLHGELRFFFFPRTFTELLQHSRLKGDQRLVVLTTDKYAVRAWVAERVGERYLIPLIAVLNRAEDLKLESLPGAFILKSTHGSGMNAIVRDKDEIGEEDLRRRVRDWLLTDYTTFAEEQHYGLITPRVVVEELLLDERGEVPADYKLFVLNQKTAMVQVITDRFSGNTRNFFTRDWRELDIEQSWPRGTVALARPTELEEMLAVAEKLAAGFEFVRVDLYAHRGRVYFGEMTHTPNAGREVFRPKEFDLALGKVWREGGEIPEKYLLRVE